MKKLLLPLFALVVTFVTAFSANAQDAKAEVKADVKGELKGDVQAGERKIAMCIGCHGIVGYQASFPEVYKVPKISGQGAKYIVSALNAYKTGERKHPSMRGIAESLTDQDMSDLAAYYESHGAVEGAVAAGPATGGSGKAVELVKKGACISCHGANFATPIDPTFPKIAGQHADYLFVALKAYKTENNAKVGRSNAVMAGIAKQFTNSELKEMAGYLSGLPGDLKVVPQARFR